MYQERTYRKHMKIDGMISFNAREYESDLQISAKFNLETEAKKAIIECRSIITEHIRKYPQFLTSLSPISPPWDAPDVVLNMYNAAQLANVGPMAAIAGAVSKYTGNHLLQFTDEVIVENGGDIFIKSKLDRRILVYAGSSPLSNRLALLIPGNDQGLGICTSSGTVGHSLSFGKADAAVILSKDAVLADAAATAVGNVVKDKSFIEAGIEYAMSIEGVDGVLIIVGDRMGAWGDINIMKS